MGGPYWLRPDSLAFPPASLACDDPPGLLAVGGDLSPDRLLTAYSQGIFPWFDDNSPILWWCPDPRMVLAPSEVHVSRSMHRFIQRHCLGVDADLSISMDQNFAAVIRHCADLRQHREGTWITTDMQNAYQQLHTLGFAHSLEIWQCGGSGKQTLVGGLYGVALGRMFFGESMFSLIPNVSKLAFIALARQLDDWGYCLIDCQLPTDHLASLGAKPMLREVFLQRLVSNQSDINTESASHWEFSAQLLTTGSNL
jgi:leucyl/phenylalanyl-tRNA---protein transferase